jgi:hypothetical protein
VWSRRTVREDAADDPKKNPEQLVLHLEIRTVRTLPVDSPRETCATRMVRDLQADGPPNLLQQKTFGSMHRNEANQEHA